MQLNKAPSPLWLTSGDGTPTNGSNAPEQHGQRADKSTDTETMFRSSTRRRPMAARQTLLGFTLIELMIVLALLAILAALAWPSYVESVQKSRRSAAIAAIAKVMQAQERTRSNQPSYTNNINQLNGAPTVSEGGHYALSIAANSATTTGYTVVATAATSQAGDRNCARMLAVVLNGNISYQSVDSAGVAATGPSPCWAQ